MLLHFIVYYDMRARIWFICQFQCLVSCIIGSQRMGLIETIDVPAVVDELEGCSDGAASDGSLDHLPRVNIASMAVVASGGRDSCTSQGASNHRILLHDDNQSNWIN